MTNELSQIATLILENQSVSDQIMILPLSRVSDFARSNHKRLYVHRPFFDWTNQSCFWEGSARNRNLLMVFAY